MINKPDNGQEEKKSGQSGYREFNRSFGLLFNIGYYMTAAIGVSLFIGYQLDRYFKTEPLFIFIFIFLGIIAGMAEIFKAANRIK